jgi:hypothetical protein
MSRIPFRLLFSHTKLRRSHTKPALPVSVIVV